jgi:hypothetical protein
MKQPIAGGVQLASIDEQNEVSQSQQDVVVPISALVPPMLPIPDLLQEGLLYSYY